MAAEGYVARGLGGVQADGRLEPLSVAVYQGDQGYWRPADVGGEGGEIVVFPFGQGVENLVGFQLFQALCFIGGDLRFLHEDFLALV